MRLRFSPKASTQIRFSLRFKRTSHVSNVLRNFKTMFAAQLIIVLAGVYILAKGRVAFSESREMIRPTATILGLAMIIVAVSSYFISVTNNVFTVLTLVGLMIVISYYFSKEIKKA